LELVVSTFEFITKRAVVLKTARWAAKEYHEILKRHPSWSYYQPNGRVMFTDEGRGKIIAALIEARYPFPPDAPLKDALTERMKVSFEATKLRGHDQPGIYRLVGCILALEVRFNQFTDENRKKFCLIIMTELEKQIQALANGYHNCAMAYDSGQVIGGPSLQYTVDRF
jgi:hypothetical protein